MIRYIIAMIATVSMLAVAEDVKAVATPEAKAAFAAKVSAVAMTAPVTIPAKQLTSIRVTSMSVTYGANVEDTRVLVAWENCATVDGKQVAVTTDNATLTYADLGKTDPMALTVELCGILKAKGKF